MPTILRVAVPSFCSPTYRIKKTEIRQTAVRLAVYLSYETWLICQRQGFIMKEVEKFNLKKTNEWLAGEIDIRVPKKWLAIAAVALIFLVMLALN